MSAGAVCPRGVGLALAERAAVIEIDLPDGVRVRVASGYAEELRRREFLRTWDLVAKVPFFKNVGASVIADVTRLLRARDYPARAVIVRRGESGDCMYFIASGEVEVQLRRERIRLGPGEFFGELALLTGEPRNATIVAAQACTLLTLDIVDFRQLLGHQPELARVVGEEAERRLAGASLAAPNLPATPRAQATQTAPQPASGS